MTEKKYPALVWREKKNMRLTWITEFCVGGSNSRESPEKNDKIDLKICNIGLMTNDKRCVIFFNED